MIGQALMDQRRPFVVIERDLRLVDVLRERGIRAIYGDASAGGVLEAAFGGIAPQKLLVIASPDGYAARRAHRVSCRVFA